jgi:hypothetical protein
MADGQGTYGGGGSVHWSVDVEDGDVPSVLPKGSNKPRAYTVKGVDKYNKGNDPEADKARFFVVGITPKPGTDVKVFKSNGTTFLAFEIDANNEQQMTVAWAFKQAQLEKDFPGAKNAVKFAAV